MGDKWEGGVMELSGKGEVYVCMPNALGSAMMAKPNNQVA